MVIFTVNNMMCKKTMKPLQSLILLSNMTFDMVFTVKFFKGLNNTFYASYSYYLVIWAWFPLVTPNAIEMTKIVWFDFFFLSDNSSVYAVNKVKCKETLQKHSFPISFVFSGSMCMVTVTNVKCSKRIKCKAFG